MAGHFGGISPVRHQQRTKNLALVGGVVLLMGGVIVAFVALGSNSSTATVTEVTKEVPAQIEMVEVLIPAQNIEAGSELKPEMFRKQQRPKAGLSSRVIRDFEEVKGHYSRSLIPGDSPLVQDLITSIRPTNVITTQIPDGYRAVTIRVDAQSAVEGWARAGARVDVTWATSHGGKEVLTTIVQNAQVLSAERQIETQAGQPNGQNAGVAIPSTVTLLVTAKDSQKIQLAKTSGTLSLVLRGDNDPGKVGENVGTLTLNDLINGPQKTDNGKPVEGTVRIGDIEYNIIGGKMVPAGQK